MKIVMAFVSIFLAGIVTLADSKELCKSIDPAACLLLEVIRAGLIKA
jgi:hypothetical protein